MDYYLLFEMKTYMVERHNALFSGNSVHLAIQTSYSGENFRKGYFDIKAIVMFYK